MSSIGTIKTTETVACRRQTGDFLRPSRHNRVKTTEMMIESESENNLVCITDERLSSY